MSIIKCDVHQMLHIMIGCSTIVCIISLYHYYAKASLYKINLVLFYMTLEFKALDKNHIKKAEAAVTLPKNKNIAILAPNPNPTPNPNSQPSSNPNVNHNPNPIDN